MLAAPYTQFKKRLFMKIGDIISSGNITGKLIRFQPKTQDLIVLDKQGEVHVILSTEAKLSTTTR